jgi:NTP pyrophosphatase (non-canonical NTP hydrolase)
MAAPGSQARATIGRREDRVDLDAYQKAAAATDQQTGDADRRLLIALLGLAGEVGTLLTEHKKQLRDGDAHERQGAVAEDLGDVLWYLAAAAGALGVPLSKVAADNLRKTADRWPGPGGPSLPPARQFDDGLPDRERLPRRFEVAFAPLPDDPGRAIGLVGWSSPLGNLLQDNTYVDDGYRWHDALHLAHAAVLGWSPVTRALLRRKRKSRPQLDDAEDGGRAIAIEEGIAAAVFDYAGERQWLAGAAAVDSALLASCRSLTRRLEVSDVTPREWEQALLAGMACWRTLRDHAGGLVTADLDARRLDHRPLSAEERGRHAEAVMAVRESLR